MNAALTRRELHGFIDAIPDQNLDTVRPILSYMAASLDEPFVIETDLTAEDHALIAEGMREYERDPSSFTPWAEVKRKAGLV
jgi:hypothetical protein